MKIQVIWSCCQKCKKLYEEVEDIVKESELDAEVEYIADITKIIQMGIMSSPVLLVDEKLAMTGYSSNKELIREKILEATTK